VHSLFSASRVKGPFTRASLVVLALFVLVIPAVDVAWNDLESVEPGESHCQLHCDPTVVLRPAAIEAGEVWERGEIFGPRLRPMLVDASIFIPPRF
jgi:hypothetical protein